MGKLIKNKMVIEFDLYKTDIQHSSSEMEMNEIRLDIQKILTNYFGINYRILDLEYEIDEDPFLQKELIQLESPKKRKK
jgi:hypothetical protein